MPAAPKKASCEHSDRRHYAHGLCRSCYNKLFQAENRRKLYERYNDTEAGERRRQRYEATEKARERKRRWWHEVGKHKKKASDMD